MTPIVSVSLGPPAIFLFGGAKRADGEHAVIGRQRINLTFRKVR